MKQRTLLRVNDHLFCDWITKNFVWHKIGQSAESKKNKAEIRNCKLKFSERHWEQSFTCSFLLIRTKYWWPEFILWVVGNHTRRCNHTTQHIDEEIRCQSFYHLILLILSIHCRSPCCIAIKSVVVNLFKMAGIFPPSKSVSLIHQTENVYEFQTKNLNPSFQ